MERFIIFYLGDALQKLDMCYNQNMKKNFPELKKAFKSIKCYYARTFECCKESSFASFHGKFLCIWYRSVLASVQRFLNSLSLSGLASQLQIIQHKNTYFKKEIVCKTFLSFAVGVILNLLGMLCSLGQNSLL